MCRALGYAGVCTSIHHDVQEHCSGAATEAACNAVTEKIMYAYSDPENPTESRPPPDEGSVAYCSVGHHLIS